MEYHQMCSRSGDSRSHDKTAKHVNVNAFMVPLMWLCVGMSL